MWRLMSAVAVFVAAILALLLFKIDACPQPMNILQYVRTYGLRIVGSPSPFQVTFLGASTLLFEDASQALLIDGFFTRPDLGFLITPNDPVTPNETAIDQALEAAQIATLDVARPLSLVGVVVNHSHFDHAMDSSIVAGRTGAQLIGSETTANIARGRMLPEAQIRVISGGENFCVGRFRVSLVRAGHVPLPFGLDNLGEITAPTVPATVGDYKEGGTFAIFVQYSGRGRTIMVQGSAGFLAGALQGKSAAVAYLAVGGLSLDSNAPHRDSYWNEVISVSPQRVVPIHWDDLSGPAASATPDDSGKAGIAFIEDRASKAGIQFRLPPIGKKVDPFLDLP
jgi:L-ascorbate metabolism protein UlaG (beta-lactamase superfamily)